jgi:hypothetical protein
MLNPRQPRPSPPLRSGQKEKIDQIEGIVRDQLQVINAIQNEEEELNFDLDNIEAQISMIQKQIKTMPDKILMDFNFIGKCYSTVVFASKQTQAMLHLIGGMIMDQCIEEDPLAFNNVRLQLDFIKAFFVALGEHKTHIKQTKMDMYIPARDSLMEVSRMVHKEVSPVSNQVKRDLRKRAKGYRNKKLYGDPSGKGNSSRW